MPKREKRLEKGIKSIEKQINLHKEKLENAISAGDLDLDLERYYLKEITSLKRTKERKKALLDRV